MGLEQLILLDADGVLVDFDGGVLRDANARTGMNWTKEDIKGWDMFQYLSHPEHPDIKEYCWNLVKEPGWCSKLEPLPGAQEAVAELSKRGKIIVVTSPWHSPTWEGERRSWLAKHLGLKSVFSGREKWALHGDFLIDDKVENVLEWFEYERCRGEGILWDPHHRYAPHHNYRKAHSWAEVYQIIDSSIE